MQGMLLLAGFIAASCWFGIDSADAITVPATNTVVAQVVRPLPLSSQAAPPLLLVDGPSSGPYQQPYYQQPYYYPPQPYYQQPYYYPEPYYQQPYYYPQQPYYYKNVRPSQPGQVERHEPVAHHDHKPVYHKPIKHHPGHYHSIYRQQVYHHPVDRHHLRHYPIYHHPVYLRHYHHPIRHHRIYREPLYYHHVYRARRRHCVSTLVGHGYVRELVQTCR